MRAVNAVQRVIMYLLLVPVLAICLDTLLRAFSARPGNPIVSRVRAAADVFVFSAFRTVFPDQTYVQTALVTLAGYGIITLIVVATLRGVRSGMTSIPRRGGDDKAAPPPSTSGGSAAKD